MIYNDSKYNPDWEIKTLNQLGEFKRGKSKHRPRNDERLFINGTFPLIQTGEIRAANLFIRDHIQAYNEFGLKQSYLWKENTLCITIAANIAETALLGYPMCFPDSVVGFNAYPDESSELFMHYIFTYIKASIQNSASGSIQDNINIEYLTALKFRIPKKKYQDRIILVLAALDSKIEINNRMNVELEANARALYEYWFVQFEFPDKNGKPYKSSGGQMQWSDKLKREIPVAWDVYGLEDIVRCNHNSVTQNGRTEFINYLDTSNLTKNVIDFVQYIDLKKEKPPSRAQRIVNRNDVLYSTVRPDQLHFGIIKHVPENLVASTGFAQLASKRKALSNELIYLFVTSDPIVDRLQKIADGSVSSYPSISPADLLDLKIALPKDDGLLETIGAILASSFERQSVNQQENAKLTEVRDWLLPLLMTGQARVREDSDG